MRKTAGRVRITAQLIDGVAGDHVWAERYDRDLTDIFALQDEISEAIVAALKLKLLPEEKRAIERRGTESPEAYDLYLMARQRLVSGNTNAREADTIVDLCRRAIEIDPAYALAWALMAIAETSLHFDAGAPEDGLAAAEQALLLDPGPRRGPRGSRPAICSGLAAQDDASAEIEIALGLDPESFEVNSQRAVWSNIAPRRFGGRRPLLAGRRRPIPMEARFPTPLAC